MAKTLDDQTADASPEETEDSGRGAGARPRLPKKGALRYAPHLAVGLSITAGLVGWAMSMGLHKDAGALVASAEPKKPTEAALLAAQTVYVTLPDVVVNLSSGPTPSFIKASFSVKTSGAHADYVSDKRPELIDTLQEYIRQLDAADLEGGEGFFNFRFECLRRLQLVLGPERVDDLLIIQLLTQ
ncbi:MAG: flagellar basal body-associated FliL family protein [Pseudomonadota bacterium]